MLLDAGAYTEAAFKHGFTPLIVTARAGREGCARLLLEAGANREARDRHGKTALDHARAEGQTSLAALLECPAPAPALAPLLESPAPAAALVRPSASRLAYHRGHSRLTAVAGLETLLAGCNLSDSVDAALAWCEAQGVDSIALVRQPLAPFALPRTPRRRLAAPWLRGARGAPLGRTCSHPTRRVWSYQPRAQATRSRSLCMPGSPCRRL